MLQCDIMWELRVLDTLMKTLGFETIKFEPCGLRPKRICFPISPERFFEDHENVVEVLSDWTRDTENKVLFLEKEEKYAVFKNPQVKWFAPCNCMKSCVVDFFLMSNVY